MYKQIPILKEAKPMENFSLYLLFSDDTEGVIDLSYIKREGLFEVWNHNFENFKIDGNRLVWNDFLDVDADSFYLKLIKKDFFEYARN